MNMKPTNKVTAGALAGAIVGIATWAADAFAGVKVPAEVAVSMSVVVTFAVQWFVPDAEPQA